MGYRVGVFKYVVDKKTGNHVILHGGGCNNDDSSDYDIFEEGRNKEELLKRILRDQKPIPRGTKDKDTYFRVKMSGNEMCSRRELYNYIKYRARPTKKEVGIYLIMDSYNDSYKRFESRKNGSYLRNKVARIVEHVELNFPNWKGVKYLKNLLK